MSEEQDWHITPKQIILIQDRIKNFSKKEGSLLINIIEAIFQARPSAKNLQDNSLKIATDQASTQLGDKQN